MTDSRRYYQLVFIWLKDLEIFERYLTLARPVVERYGGALERMLAPKISYAENIPTPDIVNVVYYADESAHRQLNDDPEFRKIVPLRSQSIEMASIEGKPRDTPQSSARRTAELGERQYLVEIARFGSRGWGGYRAWEDESGPILEGYGYGVERTMSVDSASGFSFQPDVVKVAYFERRDGMQRLEQDARHQRLERELYPAAVSESIWLLGEIHPLALGQPRP